MNEIINIIAKLGGILAVLTSLIILFFREVIKAKITDSFAKRIEQRRNTREDAFLLNQITTQIRGEVLQKLVDARLKAIERLSECVWDTSDAAANAGAARDIKSSTDQKDALTKAILKFSETIGRLSSAISFAKPHLPDESIKAATEYYQSILKLFPLLSNTDHPFSPDVFVNSWDLETLLEHQLKSAIISTIKLPDTIRLYDAQQGVAPYAAQGAASGER